MGVDLRQGELTMNSNVHPVFQEILKPYMATGQMFVAPAPSVLLGSSNYSTEQDTVSCCVSCGSTDVGLVENYGGETCSQTGARDADEYWRCFSCGTRSEEIDEKPTVIIIPPGSVFTPTTEDLLRWSTELAERAKAKREKGEAA
jgi:hypothetical protein